MNKISTIELENFKSYKGFHSIGPFKDFTSIVGPNGSGKSNIMDAISFVLGISTRNLRGRNLADMVTKTNNADSLSCSVRLIITEDDSQKLVFKRSISKDRMQTEYSLNDKSVTVDEYMHHLNNINIYPKLKNFLVFQGDVGAYARHSPKEITKIIDMISGSADDSAEYKRLAQAEKDTQEATRFQYNRKRGIVEEKKAMQLQKDEADKFKKLVKDLDDLQMKQTLLKLNLIQAKLEAVAKKTSDYMKKLKKVDAKHDTQAQKLSETKVKQANHQKESLKVQKAIREKEKELDSLTPSLAKAKEEEVFYGKRIDDNNVESKRFRNIDKERKKRIVRLDAEMEEVKREYQKLKEKHEEILKSTSLKMTDSQRHRYNELIESVGRKTAIQTQELRKQERTLQLETTSLDSLISQKSQFEDRKQRLVAEKDDIEKNVAKYTRELENILKEKKELKTRYNDIKEKNTRAQHKQKELSDKLYNIHEKLQNAKSDEKDIEKTLKRLFNGVHGRITNLFKAKDDDKEVAIATALGGRLDNIVVDTQATAYSCISYLKEQHAGSVTFIPIDTIKTTRKDESFRKKGVNFLIDELEFEERYRRAMEYICSDTLVVNDLDLARDYFHKGVRVVTVEGFVISRSGLMTGGSSALTKEKRVGKAGELSVEKLKQSRAEHLQKLAELSNQLSSFSRIQQIETRLSHAEGKEHAVKFELDKHRTQQQKNISDTKEVEAKLQQLGSEISVREEQVKEVQHEVETMRQSIDKIKDTEFAELSDELNVDSIRATEDARLKTSRQYTEQLMRLSTQQQRIEQLLEYERGRDLTTSISDAQIHLREDQAQRKKQQKQIKILEEKIAHVQSEINDLVEKYKAERTEAAALVSIIKEVKHRLDAEYTASRAFGKRVLELNSHKQRLLQDRHAIYLECQRQDMPLELISGKLPEDIDGGGVEERGIELEKDDNIKVNFSLLLEKELNLSNNEKEEYIANIFQSIRDIIVEIEGLSPNLKAVNHLARVNSTLKKTKDELETAQQSAKETAKQFKDIKANRTRKFMDAFESVSQKIQEIYSKLTGGSGTAYLTLDSLDEPYLQGIRYHPMPPNKRFGDIENLSGGERSVAALALLFAIQRYKPAPFLVLDEVDAALDSRNILSVAEYIRNECQNTQFIVISLKDKCYDKSQSLVGVYLDTDKDSSVVLTLDLAPFPES